MGRISLASSAVRERLTQLADVTVSEPHIPSPLERETEREGHTANGDKDRRTQSERECERNIDRIKKF